MKTAREAHATRRLTGTAYQACGVCGLYTNARNRVRHQKACARRKRTDYAAWVAWRGSHYEGSTG